MDVDQQREGDSQMTTQTVESWIGRIEQGPDWLFVRLRVPDRMEEVGCQIAEPVWRAMQYHVMRRVVLEMDDVQYIRSELIRELVLLHRRVQASGGLLRLSGLSDANQQVLEICRLADRFPRYRDRLDAV